MGKLIYFLILAHAFSCASDYKRPESFAQKMRRYQARLSSNSVPPLTVNIRKFRDAQSVSRIPASRSRPELKKNSPFNPSKGIRDIQNIYFSNKRLYFLSLLDQYLNFRRYLSEKQPPLINSCPGLHGAFLEYKRTHIPRPRTVLTNIQNGETLFSLPLTHKLQSKTLNDVDAEKRDSKLFYKALNVHTEKIHSELVELCQYGSSDNYYAYENLMNHIKRNPQGFFPSLENLKILIKTTIFANNILLSTLKKQPHSNISRSPAALRQKNNPWLKKAMKKNHLGWFERYSHSVK